ncbi:hypothetical protein Dxin01_03363 [Deinococcus xinjiangensis]|uniref:DUF2239 domain-containing protein n=1 Tax=Deinococcus xinjiangensis TaxID=457454 RepID=A0ABP9VEE6_9DEIO
MSDERTYTIFGGVERLTTGSLRDILTYLKTQESTVSPLIFDDHTGRQVDFDLSGTLEEVLAREVPTAPKAGRGRPKLGVTAREVTLLPRHWEWLEDQRGGASAALRRLIDEARKRDPQGEQIRAAQAATDRFLGVMAGNLRGYEEATRALYNRDQTAFLQQCADWPEHIRAHALALAAPAFGATP